MVALWTFPAQRPRKCLYSSYPLQTPRLRDFKRKQIYVAGKSRLKLHLKPLKMTGIIVKIERVDTFGREVTQESSREW